MLLTNYIISAWRNIYNHKLFSAINILGLSIGLAAVMLIALFVRDEASYDNFWTKADRIYRTYITFNIPGRDSMISVQTPGPVIHALKKDFPQVENAARIFLSEPTIILNGNYFLEDISIVDADIINIFDFNVLSGDLVNAMSDFSSLVLNETVARKYFGEQNPIDQIITIEFGIFKKDYKVAAIIEDMPTNSQLNITAMVAIDEDAWKDRSYMFEQWFSTNTQLYFNLNEGANIADVEEQMEDFINRNFPRLPFGGTDTKTADLVSLSVMNVKDLHLKSVGMGEYRQRGSINSVLTFSAVAILILIIASINFMNLSTARASQRAKEVSLRKVMGASRKNLIFQFLGESILVTLLGLLISFAIVELTLPIYNDILGKELFISYASTDIVSIVILALCVGGLSGTYPALVLSSFLPAENLKANKTVETSSSVKLRSALVIFQFAVSIVLFVSTAVVYGQMLYAKNMDLGYDHKNLLVINDLNPWCRTRSTSHPVYN
ncbi:MAG: FtsX-like permease family protein [Kordiimonadaceae bacterium]|jgi:putative ABC transport system permease protein|nr:FtsX-like permease family protein [Kordiimonadaceae bacterium]MBT6329074.1 FtsX-like permease family protein [Kordiimonadaceae bacterium]MBT7583629.1 FtsX-like permease family protein [Kordiimonadaceae bacterium]